MLKLLIVKGRGEQRLGIVTVRPMVGPLSLTLEAAGDGVVTNLFFLERIGKLLIACHEVLDDAVHLNGEFPLLFFFFGSEFDAAFFAEEGYGFGVIVSAFLAVCLGPSESLLIVLFVVDAFFHTAEDLDLVNGFDAHTEVAFHHVLIDDGACDTHALGTDLEVGFALHRSNSDCCAAEAEAWKATLR